LNLLRHAAQKKSPDPVRGPGQGSLPFDLEYCRFDFAHIFVETGEVVWVRRDLFLIPLFDDFVNEVKCLPQALELRMVRIGTNSDSDGSPG
jgi:hypothetical protein